MLESIPFWLVILLGLITPAMLAYSAYLLTHSKSVGEIVFLLALATIFSSFAVHGEMGWALGIAMTNGTAFVLFEIMSDGQTSKAKKKA